MWARPGPSLTVGCSVGAKERTLLCAHQDVQQATGKQQRLPDPTVSCITARLACENSRLHSWLGLCLSVNYNLAYPGSFDLARQPVY